MTMMLHRLALTVVFLVCSSSISLVESFVAQGPLARSRLSFLPLHETASTSTHDNDNHHHGSDYYHASEFTNLEPLPPPSQRRQARLQQEMDAQAQFVPFGSDDLWKLRDRIEQLSLQLVQRMRASLQRPTTQQQQRATIASSLDSTTLYNNNDNDLEHIRQELRHAESQDPELVYQLELADAKDATTQNAKDRHHTKALAARSCLPHYQLDGLWVGKYGIHGYELVNITYVGDTLIATKVTGDRNVPRGEITFQIDLNPLRPRPVVLQPIVLSAKASSKWGTQKLPRYNGLGQVAEDGFRNHQWMDGQLIIIGKEYFSFAWIPIEQQIFFGRPSPELALKMLRDNGVAPLRLSAYTEPAKIDDHLDIQKDFVTRCLERTDEVFEDELEMQLDDTPGFSCIWRGNELEECYFE